MSILQPASHCRRDELRPARGRLADSHGAAPKVVSASDMSLRVGMVAIREAETYIDRESPLRRRLHIAQDSGVSVTLGCVAEVSSRFIP